MVTKLGFTKYVNDRSVWQRQLDMTDSKDGSPQGECERMWRWKCTQSTLLYKQLGQDPVLKMITSQNISSILKRSLVLAVSQLVGLSSASGMSEGVPGGQETVLVTFSWIRHMRTMTLTGRQISTQLTKQEFHLDNNSLLKLNVSQTKLSTWLPFSRCPHLLSSNYLAIDVLTCD